jgi:benzaldehyde dehydrogenase (NAD)
MIRSVQLENLTEDWRALSNGRIFSNRWQVVPETQDVVEPATGAVLGRVGIAAINDVAIAAAKACTAQRPWAATDYELRAARLRAAAAYTEQNRGILVEWLVRESGSVRAKAEFEVALSIKALHQASALPLAAIGQVLPSVIGRVSLARRVPIGVVGIISPFNFPLYLAIRAVAPALALGNAVVLKPDSRTAISGGLVIAKIFEAAGLPADVLHVLPGNSEVGEAMCTDRHIGMIQFTGSTRAGRMVGKLAGEHLKKISLELGGKNSLIILDDADLDLAVANARWSAYLHQGQICMSAGRILVDAKIAPDFSRRMAEKAKSTLTGNPASEEVALGPMISSNQVDNAMRIVTETVAQGATLMAGGTRSGLFLSPTVLADVTRDMPAYKEEIFGPVAVISSFNADADAVRMANDTEFGLSAGVISASVGRALAMGEQLRVGLLHINDQTVNDDVVNPFGGVGASGNGTSLGGEANWEQFTHWQWVTLRSSAPAYPL